MAPPSDTTTPAPPRLPIPRAAMSAFDQCRRHQPPAATASLATTIIRAALAHGHSSTSHSLRYVIRRLLTGVSASVGASRLNYSITLAGLTRQLHAAGGRPAVDQLLTSLRTIYGRNGTFKLGYSGADRERALGTLAATAALVAGMEPSTLPAATIRELVALLRTTVDGDAAKWRLGCAAVHIVRRLLTVIKTGEREAVVRPMWAWCQERREKEDGLQMAFMLHDAGLVSNNAFRKLYPTLADGLETALMDTFESGFSSVGELLGTGDCEDKDGVSYIVSYAWSMAVRYMLTPAGAEHFGNVSHFWQSIVRDKLVRGSRSGEKKLLMVELIPLVLAEVNDVKTFDAVFDNSVASTIAVILGTRRGKSANVLLRKNRTSDDVLRYMKGSAKTLGKRMITQIRDKEKGCKASQPLLRAFLMWGVRGGILNQLLPPALLSEALATLPGHDVKILFSEAVEEFAHPRNDGYDAREFGDVCNSVRRANALQFIFTLAREHEVLAEDAIRIVSMYCVFEQGGDVLRDDEQSILRPNAFEKCSLSTTWCGILPGLNPSLSANVAALGFRRLVDFLTTQRRNDRVDVLLTFCVKLISSIVSSKKHFLKPRMYQDEKAHPEWELKFFAVQRSALKTVEKLSYASDKEKTKPLSHSLRIVAMFLYLYLYDPHSGEVIDSTRPGGSGDILTMLRKVNQYADYILEAVPQGDHLIETANLQIQAGEEGETPPEPVEYIAHLITDLCRQEAACFRQIAIIAIEALDCALDDSVVAVLFDAVDSYLSGDSVEVPFGGSRHDGGESDSSDHDENEDDSDASNSACSSDEEGDDVEDVGALKLTEIVKEAAPCRIPNPNEGDSNASAEDTDIGTDQEVDVDIDIDSEDPAVLADFDKRLGAHLRLLKQEKKAANQRKLRIEARYVWASRVLDVVEAIARVLRMRLEKSQVDARLPVVFLDLHVRLYEFVLTDASKNFRFLKQVCGIVSKQMLVPMSVFLEKVLDVITVSEIANRFFEALRGCRTDQKVPTVEARIISRSAGCLTGVAISLSNGDYSRYLPVYQEILVTMLKPGSHFWTPEIFNSFLQRAPIVSLKMSSRIEEALSLPETTKSMRRTASEVFLALSMAACKVEDSGSAEVTKFWDTANGCLRSHCVGNSARNWSAEGYANMVRLAATGLHLDRFADADALISQLETGVKTAALSHRDQARLLKLLNKPKKDAKDKRQAADTIAGQEMAVRKKKRKTMKGNDTI